MARHFAPTETTAPPPRGERALSDDDAPPSDDDDEWVFIDTEDEFCNDSIKEEKLKKD